MDDMMMQAQETFINESLDLLQEMETSLNLLSDQPDDEELINSVFRAAHTIKGSAGLFGFDAIVAFTHKVENVLDEVRAGEVKIDDGLIAVLLECRDHIEAMIEAIGADADPALSAVSDRLVKALLKQAHGEEGAVEAKPDAVKADTPATYQAQVGREESRSVENDQWHISLRFGEDVLRNGMDPLSFLRYLASLGEVTNVATTVDAMPAAAEMDAESCYLGMEITFNGDVEKQALMDVFDFVAEDSLVNVMPPNSKISEYAQLLEALIESRGNNARIGDLLIEVGALTQRELDQALAYQAGCTDDTAKKPLGEVLVDQHSVHQSTINAALGKQKKIQERRTQENRSIRVDAGRLDQLINLVGELVIAGAGSGLRAQQLGDETLLESMSLVSRLVEEIRDRSLRLRMVPIGETFSRFNRVVRDVAKELDKSITLVIDGAETELDKSVVEKIGDPLTHLVRNAIDHGLESPQQRLAAGKPEKGTVRLNAYHDSGNIVLEVSDDGAGIDPDKVLAKAIANGLVSANQKLSRPEILRLILEAGLTTKETVSDLSGRGVGMDVVKKNVEALRGSIEVESELGQGTSIRIRLPLTLSIIDGFLVGVGRASYVIPLDSVVECIEHGKEAEVVREHGGDYISLRGDVLPFLDLRQLFDEQPREGARENIVVVQCSGQKAGLVVDELMGEYQTVIKPLNQIFAKLSGISGSTILGSGEVAMILDVGALVGKAEQRTLLLS